MQSGYTTQDLIQILTAEREACLRGDRLNLKASAAIGHPALDQLLNPTAVQKFTAFQDFQAQIHAYQQTHQVSGLVWQTVRHGAQTICFPCVHEYLIALPQDLPVLRSAKAELLGFWWTVTDAMDWFMALHAGKAYQPTTRSKLAQIADQSEWANLWKSESANFLQITLQLGWGLPHEANYPHRSESAGLEYFVAVKPGQQPIG